MGSVFVQGEQMRIDARLVHVSTGKILLTEEMSGRASDFFSLEKNSRPPSFTPSGLLSPISTSLNLSSLLGESSRLLASMGGPLHSMMQENRWRRIVRRWMP